MNDELVKRLREIHPEEFGDAWDFAFACQQAMHEAADAIEKLTAYVALYKDGWETAMKVAQEYKAAYIAERDARIAECKREFMEKEQEAHDAFLKIAARHGQAEDGET